MTDPVDRVVRALGSEHRFAPHVAAVERFPPAPARFADWPDGIDASVRSAAARLGFERPYTHQAEAVATALAGRHVALVAGTASGKSLGYAIPILDRLVRHPDARALLIFPTKALAQDQLEAFRQWDAQLDGAGIRPAAYDGDTPRGARSEIRRSSRVVVTNPDMLHTGILPRHTAWASFFTRLSAVVVDEMHAYRGVFGSHVANVLRRLRRVARFYGAAPWFALTSATIANPAELARTLAGGPVHVVAGDGAPRGARTFLVYNPPVVDPRLNLRRPALLESAALARRCLDAGLQTIVFARSRQRVELLVRTLNDGYLNESAPVLHRGEPDRAGGGTADRDGGGMVNRDGGGTVDRDGGGTVDRHGEAHGGPVRGYRGGYTPGERRAIERDLRSGGLRGVVATNALELGIDIGGLDVCVMAGYPGTIASTWQQAGRAGRRAGAALAVLVAEAGPLDQFIARHPEYLFGRSPEHARVDPDNLLILLDHLRCAAFELPFHSETEEGEPADSAYFDDLTAGAPTPRPSLAALLAVLEAQGALRRAGGTWYWLAGEFPAERVNLRSAGPGAVAVVVRRAEEGGAAPADRVPGRTGDQASTAYSDQASTAYSDQASTAYTDRGVSSDPRYDVLGTVDHPSAPMMVHPGAIYLHAGRAYQVETLDLAAGRAVATPTDGAIYTRASSRTTLTPLVVRAERAAAGAGVAHGELEVRTRATGYRRVRFRTHETVGWGDIDLPEQAHVAGGYWFTLDDAALDRLRSIGRWDHDPLTDRGPSWRAQAARARARDGHACRLCGAPERDGRAHDVHHIRPFRSFGFVKGENARDAEANALDNLITLCRGCHRVAERALGLHGGLSGVGHVLGHVAPLFLMCDARDLGVSAESHAPWTGRPTVAVYERAAAGVGFGEALFALHERVIAAAAALVADCACDAGCPACVGPADGGGEAKAHALAVLGVLRTDAAEA